MNINKYRQSRINVPPKGVDAEYEKFNRIELDRIRRQPWQNKEERMGINHNTTRQEHQQITRIDSSSTASNSGRSLYTAKEQEVLTMVERVLGELLSITKEDPQNVREDDSIE